MAFARTELAQIVGKKLQADLSSRTLAKELAAFLLAENRVSDLDSLMRDVMAYRQEAGIVEAEVASAHPLDDAIMRQVKQLLADKFPNAKKIIVHQHIDESIVGGLTISLANEKLDMSIKSQLDTFRRLTTEGII